LEEEPLSYDLAVFDPSTAPKNALEFTEWYDVQTEWKEPHGYDDPVVSTPALRAWFMDMLQEFPAMNGPFARPDEVEDEDEELRTSNYSVGHSMIYGAFAWSKATEAYEACYRLAAKHGVGFIDASGDEGNIWFPNGEDGRGLVRAFSLIPDDRTPI
jgi:hypothetical protein